MGCCERERDGGERAGPATMMFGVKGTLSPFV